MNPVNLFFACDNAYVPFLAVTLTSLKENCNPKRDYALRILHTGLDPENDERKNFHCQALSGRKRR